MTEQKKSPTKKVGWFCTYTPEELIYAAGFMPYRLLPEQKIGESSVEDVLPGNICPYPRKILSNLRSGIYEDMEGIVVANSCNAMIHLYNALKEESDLFIYLLDIPRRQDEQAINYFTRELELLAGYLGEKGQPVSEESLRHAVEIYRQKSKLIELCSRHLGLAANGLFPAGLYGLALDAAGTDPEIFIHKMETIVEQNEKPDPEAGTGPQDGNQSALLLAGGLPPQGLVEMLSEQPGLQIYPENCAGIRYLHKFFQVHYSRENPSLETILNAIARNYLEKPPCPRVFNSQAREDYYRQLLDDLQVQAVIYHDLMFCDMCHYDYLMLKELLKEKDIPHLKVKTELGDEDLGQLKTRVEAFLEILD